MRPHRLALATGLGLALSLSCAPLALAADPAAPAAHPARHTVRHTAQSAMLQPEAVQAIKRMSAYLATLPAFEVKATTSLDLVNDADQALQLDGTARYKVRRPDGFVIDVVSDRQSRRFIYDGKQLTVFSPGLGYYATVPAPPTIRQTLDAAYAKFGIALPLEDLFTWSDPASDRTKDLISGFMVGTATIDGVETTQYAFRQKNVDWQVWIQTGDHPLPRKLVIVDRTDPARPAYSARLSWELNPAMSAADFAFQPGKDDKAIKLAAVGK
jgi:hypothetical protein